MTFNCTSALSHWHGNSLHAMFRMCFLSLASFIKRKERRIVTIKKIPPLNWSTWYQDKYLLPIQGCLEGQNPVKIGVDCRETGCSFKQHNWFTAGCISVYTATGRLSVLLYLYALWRTGDHKHILCCFEMLACYLFSQLNVSSEPKDRYYGT